jgi:DNA-directed RNA polymerase subunit RPC12/RpoP
MIQVEERDDLNPICPHCSVEIKKVFAKKLESALGVRFIYFCSSCKKTLGVSHRKGFWMG